jgi:predicted PurR-regulated permease PerM
LLLCLIQFGIIKAIIVAIGYAAVNVVMGNLVEPRYMGKGLGLSPLVVFLSLLFWGWTLGPVGMFLSVPLTVTAKIALASREESQWIAVMLGPVPERHAKKTTTAK